MKAPALSTIIISFNTKDITLKCLQTIYDEQIATNDINEVIIWDNVSRDGTIEAIQGFIKNHSDKPNLTFSLHSNPENIGFGTGNNRALPLTDAPTLLLLNSDTEVLDNAIQKLYDDFISKNNEFGIVGGKLFNLDLSPQASCGPYFTLPVIIGFLLLRGEYWGFSRYSPNEIKQVDWISGACMMMTREIFEQNQFDEEVFMYMEEIELQYRARKQGVKIGFYPNAHFIHHGAASSGNKIKPIQNTFKGFVWLYKKHHSKLELFLLLLILKFKAFFGIFIGKILKNDNLIKTYEGALQIISY